MKKNLPKWMLFLTICCIVAIFNLFSEPAESQQSSGIDKTKIEAARAFFKGKYIEFIVGTEPGSSYDGKARLMVPFIEKFIPGVKVLVKNMPGAGGMTSVNAIYRAKPDGLTIGIAAGVGMVANQIAGSPVIRYKATEFNYLGRINAERRVLVASNESKVKDAKSVMKADFPVKQALTGPGSGSYAITQLVLRTLGFPRKEILGYKSGPEAELAVIKGEVDLHMGSEDGAMPIIETKEVRPILQLSPTNIVGLENIPNLLTKDVDTFGLSKEQLRRINLAGDLMGVGRIIIASPGIPPERVRVLEEAVQRAIKDPEYVSLCQKSGDARSLDPLSGKELAELVNRLLNLPADLRAELQGLMKTK